MLLYYLLVIAVLFDNREQAVLNTQTQRTHYEVLGVASNATPIEIKRAFRKLARKHHPDSSNSNGEMFKNISYANDTLSDETKRQSYDELLHQSEREVNVRQPAQSSRHYADTFDLGAYDASIHLKRMARRIQFIFGCLMLGILVVNGFIGGYNTGGIPSPLVFILTGNSDATTENYVPLISAGVAFAFGVIMSFILCICFLRSKIGKAKRNPAIWNRVKASFDELFIASIVLGIITLLVVRYLS